MVNMVEFLGILLFRTKAAKRHAFFVLYFVSVFDAKPIDENVVTIALCMCVFLYITNTPGSTFCSIVHDRCAV